MSDFFSADYLAAIQSLHLAIGPVRAATVHGEHRSPRLGGGMDFRDFQAYTPGDDLRRMDWNVYQRTGHLFTRQFDFLQSLPIYLVLDLSDSMFFETPSRARAVLNIAGAIAAAALRRQDMVEIFGLGSSEGPVLRRVTGRNQLPRVLEFLAGLKAAGATHLPSSLERVAAQTRRPGVAIVLSDFFDESPVEEMTGALSHMRHRKCIVRIGHSLDDAPPPRGDLELVDCESGRRRMVRVNAKMLENYQTAYKKFVTQLEQGMQQAGAHYYTVNAADDVMSQLRTLFPQGTMVI